MCNASEEAVNAVCILQGFSWLDFLSPVAILTSAFVAFIAATRAIKHQRAIARRGATLDVILRLETDSSYQAAAATFRDVRDVGGLPTLLEQTSQSGKKELLQVQTFLNHYELICCGIMEDTLDELFYFQWYRGAFIHHYHNSKELITEFRKKYDNPRAFQRYELFATTWDADKFVAITKKKPSWYIDNHQNVANMQD